MEFLSIYSWERLHRVYQRKAISSFPYLLYSASGSEGILGSYFG